MGSWVARRYDFHWRDGPLRLPEPLRNIENTFLQFLIRLSENQQAPLLVFMDSVVLLHILQKRGKASFNPRPNDILHFDVIFPLLNVLRQ